MFENAPRRPDCNKLKTSAFLLLDDKPTGCKCP